MKTIYLSGVVGYEITADRLRREIDFSSKERIRLVINSAGGYVVDAFEIYDLLQTYKGEIEGVIMAYAASAATYILMAADKITAFQNSIFMGHRAQVIAMGTYKDMQREAHIAESMDNLIAEAYTKRIKKSRDEILSMMDEEIWLVGWEQLLAAGIIDDVIDKPEELEIPELEEDDDMMEWIVMSAFEPTKAQAKVRMNVTNIQNRMRRDEERTRSNAARIAAFLPLDDTDKNNINAETHPATLPDNNNQEVSDMTLKELLDKHPEAKAEYENNLHAAEAKGAELVKNDRQRIAGILNHAGVKLSNEAIQAIDGNMDSGKFAEEELARQRALRNEQPASPFAALAANNQTPREQDPGGASDAENKAKADAEFDKKLEESAKKYAKAGRF